MKRLLFGILLTVVGTVYSAICFHRAVADYWYYNGINGLLGSFVSHNILMPFLFSLLLVILGLAIGCFEAFRRK